MIAAPMLPAAAHRAGRGHRPGLGRVPHRRHRRVRSSSPCSSSASSCGSAAATTASPARSASTSPSSSTYTIVPLRGRRGAVRHHVRSRCAPSTPRPMPTTSTSPSSVIGFRWQWRFEYPDQGVIVSGSEQEVPELVLPTSSTVRFEVTSVDVVHSFWIPGFRFKRDMFPDQDVDGRRRHGRDRPASGRQAGCARSSAASTTTRCTSTSASCSPEEFEQWIAEQRGPRRDDDRPPSGPDAPSDDLLRDRRLHRRASTPDGERKGLPRTLIGWLTTHGPQGDRRRLRRDGAGVPGHRRRAGRPHPGRAGHARDCRSSTRRSTTRSSRSTAA